MPAPRNNVIKNNSMRTEKDFIGSVDIPEDALYGIHSVRAKNNFPDDTPFLIEWYKSVGIVKQACYETYLKFKQAAQYKYRDKKPCIHKR